MSMKSFLFIDKSRILRLASFNFLDNFTIYSLYFLCKEAFTLAKSFIVAWILTISYWCVSVNLNSCLDCSLSSAITDQAHSVHVAMTIKKERMPQKVSPQILCYFYFTICSRCTSCSHTASGLGGDEKLFRLTYFFSSTSNIFFILNI